MQYLVNIFIIIDFKKTTKNDYALLRLITISMMDSNMSF